MKRYTLCSLFLLCIFGSNALAASAPGLPNGRCFTESERGIDYTVYFENARPTPAEENSTYADVTPTATQQCKSELANTLGTLRAQSTDDCIILLAGANAAGDASGYDNDALSIRRAGIVLKMLTSAETHGDCIRAFVSGSANSYYQDQETDETIDIYTAEERSVRVIITRKSEVNNITLPPITINLTNNDTTVALSTSITTEYDDRVLLAKQTATDIGVIVSELNRMNDAFERSRSRWKTASGNFNGARLASDSIAGVVLGTAGGLITSNIIKKNQIRGGFEDLQCVIGGQIVANFDDDFTINMNLNR